MAMWQDVTFALRLLAKERWFTLAVVLVLALGISSTNTVFTLVNGVLLRDMPFEDPDRIVQLGNVSYLDLQDWRAATRTFDGIAASAEQPMSVSDDAVAAERFRGAYVSADAFALLGARPALGRDFRAEDQRAGAGPVVILGYAVWHSRYGAAADIVGRTIRVNGVASDVIGVMPEGFEFPLNAKLWQPLSAMRAGLANDRTARALTGFGRLRSGVTIEQARTDLAGIAAALGRRYPDAGRERHPNVEPFRSGLGGPIVAVFAAMMGAVVFVLLIACANVANLLLARAAERSREVSLRMSLGASRGRIVRQLLTESVVMALVAGVIALALSAVEIRVLWNVLNGVADPPPFWLRVPLDGRVFAFLATLCLGTAVVIGLVPALQTSKTSIVDVLTEAGRGSTGHRRSRRWTSVFVVAQLALTLVLLTGAGLMMQNLLMLVRMDAGIDTAGLVRMGIELPASLYDSPERRRSFYQQLDEGLAAVSGGRASLASSIPNGGAPEGRLLFEGRPDPPEEQRPRTSIMTVGPRYFETVGAPLIGGRSFVAGDGLIGRSAAIVNQRFVEMYFDGADALGRRIRLGSETDWLEIVGVAANVRQRTTASGAFDPIVYRPVAASAPTRTIVLIRPAGDRSAVESAVRRRVHALDDDLPLFDVHSVDAYLAMSRWGQRVFGSIFAIFAGIAVLLAIVGLYAVTAYSVAQRTREIGVRIALGAQARQVWWLVTRRASAQLAAGLVLGGAGAAAVSRVVPAMLAGPRAGDSVFLLLGVSVVLLAAGLGACVIPARRAMRLDPVSALRAD